MTHGIKLVNFRRPGAVFAILSPHTVKGGNSFDKYGSDSNFPKFKTMTSALINCAISCSTTTLGFVLAMMVCDGLASEEKKTMKPADKTAALSPAVAADLAALAKEKEARTPAQRKLDSHIVLELKKSRGEPPFDKPTSLRTDLAMQPDGRVLVDMNAKVTKELLNHIASIGGKVISSFPDMHAIRALVPLTRLEELAGRTDVKFISPASEPMSNSVGNKSAATGNSTSGVEPARSSPTK